MLMKYVFGLAVAAAMAAPAHADDNIRLSLGYSTLSDEYSDDNFSGITARGAYYFTKNIGVEAEFTTGVNSISLPNTILSVEGDNYFITSTELELEEQMAAYVVGRLPFGESMELTGRAGYTTGEISVSGSARLDGTADPLIPFSGTVAELDGFAAGVGFNFFFSKTFGAGLDVTHYFIDDGAFEDVDNVSISLIARF
jgi:hypothetical protein